MRWLLVLLAAVFIGGAALARLASSDPLRWHTDPALGAAGPNSHVARSLLPMPPAEALAAFDRVAMSEPRTTRLAGRPEEGRITYVSRSRVWGFPDYTTVSAVPSDGGSELIVFARARFGQSDMGVNGKRVARWLSQLVAGVPAP